MKKVKSLLLALLVVAGHQATANPGVWLDLPVYEYPFNSTTTHGPDYFSMRQSSAISTGFLQTVHRGIGGDSKESVGWWRWILIGGFDYLTSTVPVGAGWGHEEWHRAVMTRREIGSFNSMNAFPWGQGVIAVDHVNDADLIKLKDEHPAEMVRLSSAGMEAQVYQNMLVEKSHFYRDARSRDTFLLWFNNMNVTSYMLQCASTDADKTTDEEMAEEGADVKRRDFTGLDCTAWVYDLFRPDEPYANRGTHPSGVGIKRYIKYSDLTSEEQNFLKLQASLSYFNFVDPFLFGFTDFKAGWGRWNFKFNHYLTSFGGTVDANLFLEMHKHKFLVTLHNGMTPKRYFPGMSLQWIDAQLTHHLFVTLGTTAWMQPKDQRYDAEDAEWLLDGNIEVALRTSDAFEYYVGYESKTPGWKAGNVYLDDNWSVWTGFRLGLF
ncbi:hypothetical protein ACNH6C_09135 [Bdellovibrio bacteriovorus]|uniref:hypothetical protein n=1 Tax=Bdellovibrio bacteriovorus TaxID=959 RepID=UPI0035A5C6F6